MNITAPMLFGNIKSELGSEECFYCAGKCGKRYGAGEYVKKTFTNRDIVKRPGSEFVCKGCVSSFNEKCSVTLVSGEERKNQRVRSYSWVISLSVRIAATKAHRKFLREICLNPPEPPFVVVISDSGKKHLIFRAPVAMSRNEYPVMLEEEVISVVPRKLKDRIEMLKPLIGAAGKRSLFARFSDFNLAVRLFEVYGGMSEKMLEDFFSVRNEALTRLALWLSSEKEDY